MGRESCSLGLDRLCLGHIRVKDQRDGVAVRAFLAITGGKWMLAPKTGRKANSRNLSRLLTPRKLNGAH